MTLTLDLNLPQFSHHRVHYTEASADFSDCGRYRYRLKRRWAQGPALMFIQLNPSTAGADRDDATVRRDVGFALGFGYSAITALNIYAGKATQPRDLAAMADPIGPDNDAYIDRAAADHDLIVFAWGHHADPVRARTVASRVWRICAQTGASVACLGWTASGQPKHPVRLPADTPLQTLTAGAHPNFVDVDARCNQLLADTSDQGADMAAPLESYRTATRLDNNPPLCR
jgi:hypothetical protein